MEATSTGVGMDLAAGCHGVPVSYRGAGSSAVILRVVPCRNFPSVRMVQSGSRVKDSLRMEVMFRQQGDIIFFDWEDDGSIDHVGIVESVGKGNVNTVEGNSGDKVKRCSYPIGDSEIYGYGTLVT